MLNLVGAGWLPLLITGFSHEHHGLPAVDVVGVFTAVLFFSLVNVGAIAFRAGIRHPKVACAESLFLICLLVPGIVFGGVVSVRLAADPRLGLGTGYISLSAALLVLSFIAEMLVAIVEHDHHASEADSVRDTLTPVLEDG